MAEPEDLESYWKIVRRTQFESASPQTISVGAAIERIILGLEEYAKLFGRTEEKSERASVSFFSAADGKWRVLLKSPSNLQGLGTEDKPTIEEALEHAFNVVLKALATKVREHEKHINEARQKAADHEGIIRTLRGIMAKVGDYTKSQLNLPDPPPPPKSEGEIPF